MPCGRTRSTAILFFPSPSFFPSHLPPLPSNWSYFQNEASGSLSVSAWAWSLALMKEFRRVPEEIWRNPTQSLTNGTHTFSDRPAPPASAQRSRGPKVLAPRSLAEPEVFLPLQPNCVLAAPTEGVLLPHLALVPLSIPKAPSLLGLGLGQEWRAGKGAPSLLHPAPRHPERQNQAWFCRGPWVRGCLRGWERLGRVHYHCYRQVPELLMSLKLEAAGRS